MAVVANKRNAKVEGMIPGLKMSRMGFSCLSIRLLDRPTLGEENLNSKEDEMKARVPLDHHLLLQQQGKEEQKQPSRFDPPLWAMAISKSPSQSVTTSLQLIMLMVSD